MCLICDECFAVLKDYNVWRHHIEERQTFRANFPKGSQERAANVQSLIACYNRSCSTIAVMHSPRKSYSSVRSRFVDIGKEEKDRLGNSERLHASGPR